MKLKQDDHGRMVVTCMDHENHLVPIFKQMKIRISYGLCDTCLATRLAAMDILNNRYNSEDILPATPEERQAISTLDIIKLKTGAPS